MTSSYPFSEISSERSRNVFSIRALISILLLAAVVSTSCRSFDPQVANETFLKENPSYTIVDTVQGDASFDVFNLHFKYRKPDDPALYEQIWRYEHGGTQWVLDRRGKETKFE